MQGYFSTVQRQGTVSEKQLSWSVVHLEVPWSPRESILSHGHCRRRGPLEDTSSQWYLNRLKNGKGPHIVIFLILFNGKIFFLKNPDTSLVSMVEYISKGLKIRYLSKLCAGVWLSPIPKALFFYFMINIFFLFSPDKDSSFLVFSCDISYSDWICQIASVTFDYVISCQETMKNKTFFYVLLKEVGFMVHQIFNVNTPLPM